MQELNNWKQSFTFAVHGSARRSFLRDTAPASSAVLVVTLECLDAFDHLIWLRTGERAAEAMGCNQSTISRHSSKCQKIFSLRLRRFGGEWVEVGADRELLLAERRLHQSYRWELDLPLRFEAQHWMRDFYAPWQSQGLLKGNQNYLEYQRPLYLLKNRIIDAWLCGAPDLPDDPELTCLPLFEMPMRLVARRDHPLHRRQPPLSLEEVAAYPLLPLPQQAFPVFQARLEAIGLATPADGSQPPASTVAFEREEAEGAEGEGPEAEGVEAEGLSFEASMLGIASALTLPLYGPDYRLLPVEIPIQFGDVLVLRSEFAAHRRCLELLDSLLAHIRSATAECADVQMLEPQSIHRARMASRRR